MKILYLEDNAQDASLVKRYIQTTDHTLEVVETIQEAEQSADENVDLYMLDIMIKNTRNGLNYVKKLRQEGCSKPLVAVTALSSHADVQRCRDAGFHAVLVKPYTITNLAQIIEEINNKTRSTEM